MTTPVRVLIAVDHALFRAGVKALLASMPGSGVVAEVVAEASTGADALYDPKIAQRILQFFNTSRRDLPLNVFPDLTEREREVLGLIAAGPPTRRSPSG